MVIVENSNIVNWGDYPEYVCALVMQTNRDLMTDSGFICPKGEEITWLCDKSPLIEGDSVSIGYARINCLGGLGFRGVNLYVDLDVDLKEIHYKPRPKLNIVLSGELEIKEM